MRYGAINLNWSFHDYWVSDEFLFELEQLFENNDPNDLKNSSSALHKAISFRSDISQKVISISKPFGWTRVDFYLSVHFSVHNSINWIPPFRSFSSFNLMSQFILPSTHSAFQVFILLALLKQPSIIQIETRRGGPACRITISSSWSQFKWLPDFV